MSFLKLKKYKLWSISNGWDTNSDFHQDCGEIYLSAIPSRDDILQALTDTGEFVGLSQDYIDNLKIERPDGWNYKVIKIYAYGNLAKQVWKFEPMETIS